MAASLILWQSVHLRTFRVKKKSQVPEGNCSPCALPRVFPISFRFVFISLRGEIFAFSYLVAARTPWRMGRVSLQIFLHPDLFEHIHKGPESLPSQRKISLACRLKTFINPASDGRIQIFGSLFI